MITEMTPETIAIVVGAIIALALEVLPWLRTWWDTVPAESKPGLVFGLSVLLPLIAVGAACLGVNVGLGAVCLDPSNAQMWWDTFMLGVLAFASSQVTYKFVAADLGARMTAKTDPVAVNPNG